MMLLDTKLQQSIKKHRNHSTLAYNWIKLPYDGDAVGQLAESGIKSEVRSNVAAK